MDFQQIPRDAEKVKKALQIAENGAVIAKKPMAIYVPERWQSKDLVDIGNEIYITAIYALVVEESVYAVSNVNAMVRIEPTTINRVTINDKPYTEFVFEPGDQVIASQEVVVNEKLLFFIFDEMVSRSNVPAYMNYLDLGQLFSTAKSFADVNLAATPTILHMLLTTIARDPDNKRNYFRQVTDGNDFGRVAYVPLDSSLYGATNTTARLMGSYFSDNLNSALIDPSEKNEPVEELLRK